jgi:fucose 4-O-acetylase-like acetyltransferase
MVLLVFVHGYNLNNRYLLPFSIVDESVTTNTFLQYFLANGIFRFRISMLFIISGYLFSMKDIAPYRERIKKRVRTLLVPYVLWSAAALIVTMFFEQWSVTRMAVVQASLGPFAEKRILEYGPMEFMVRLVLAPLPFQLWFIRCLFIYNLMYPWLKKAVLHYPGTTLTLASILWITSFFGWFVEGEGLLFFTLGIWLCKSDFNIQQLPSWLRITPLLCLWVIVALIKTWLAFKGQIGSVPIELILTALHKFVVLSGLIGIWYGCDPIVRFLMNQRWFVWMSAFSFIIYALHAPLINYSINLAFFWSSSILHYRLLTFFFLPVLVVSVCILVGVILRSCTPRFYSILTGGRGLA